MNIATLTPTNTLQRFEDATGLSEAQADLVVQELQEVRQEPLRLKGHYRINGAVSTAA